GQHTGALTARCARCSTVCTTASGKCACPNSRTRPTCRWRSPHTSTTKVEAQSFKCLESFDDAFVTSFRARHKPRLVARLGRVCVAVAPVRLYRGDCCFGLCWFAPRARS